MKKRKQVDVTASELAILECLWSHGTSTVRVLADILYPEGGPSSHATVQKLLERLEKKNCVSKKPEGRANLYRAEVAREALIRNRLRETADSLAGGSLTPLLTQLVNHGEFSKEELRELRELVDELDD
jgi:predicted transcriptional regulator